MRALAFALLLAGCGRGDAPVWAGSWAADASVEMTLLGAGTSVSGAGVEHGATDLDFTVTGSIGTPAGSVTFNYLDGTDEGFVYSQPDEDHLTLANPSRSLQFVRE